MEAEHNEHSRKGLRHVCNLNTYMFICEQQRPRSFRAPHCPDKQFLSVKLRFIFLPIVHTYIKESQGVI